MKKRIIGIFVCAALLFAFASSLSSCSRPPEYAEIEARFKELIEASYEINKVLFGEGLPTHERIYDPWDNMEVQKKTDENGKDTFTYYCRFTDESYGELLGYRTGWGVANKYLQVLSAPDESRELVYEDKENGKYYYTCNYTEPEGIFYYSSSDPDNYDYVSSDSPYLSVDAIKTAAEKVYSKDYLETSVYVALFTGVSLSDNANIFDSLSARYIDYGSLEGDSAFMMSNEYKPLINETRIFDLSTAKVVRPGSKKIVNIEVETYLESKPEERTVVRVTMVKQDGQWYLDNGTY